MAAASKPEVKGELFVVAPLVEVDTTDGKRVRLGYGDVVTDNVSKESVALLKDLGFTSDKNPRDGVKDED